VNRFGRGRQPATEMVSAEVVRLLDAFEAAKVKAWLDGGWGVDALLGEQQRPHDDLDLVVELKDVATVEDVLRRAGYTDKDREAPLSFMVVDSEGRQVDIHPVVFDDDGNGLYQMDNRKTWTYPADGFCGVGRVGGKDVRCLSPRVQMLVHSGYELSKKDHDEIRALHDRFGVDPPRGYSWPAT
jgi:lincosamide nucleotidyltransferase A/C/D/E